MESNKASFASIDEYIATFPSDVQEKLEQMRATIRAAAPDAVEKISYQMPTFAQNGNLVLFAAWKGHIGFYGTSHAILEALGQEASVYANAKGSLLFTYDKPLPAELIGKIVRLRVAENLKNAQSEANQT